MASDTEWMKSLKVGDEVAVPSYGWSLEYTIEAVSEVNGRWVTTFHRRWSKKTGREIGSTSYTRLEPATDELRREIAERKRRDGLRTRAMNASEWLKKNWRSMPEADVLAVLAVIEPTMKRETADE